MKKFLIISTAISIVFLGSFAAQAGDIRDEYDLEGVSEEQFNKDVAECREEPIDGKDVAIAVLGGFGALTPYGRLRICLGERGYKFSTKAAPGTFGHCQDIGGQWDDSTGECFVDASESTPRVTDSAEEAKLNAGTRHECLQLNGEWDTQGRTCL